MRGPVAVVVLGLAACGDAAVIGSSDATTDVDLEAADAPACPATCPASPSPCEPNLCRPETGVCAATRLPEGTPCDRDGDPETEDACSAQGLCVSATPVEPPPVVCGAIAAELACDAVVGPLDGLIDVMRDYDCGASLPGGELVFAFTPAVDGQVEVTLDAAPRDYVRVVTLDATCDAESCVGEARAGDSHVLPVTAGRTTFFVVDATIGGVVELTSLRLRCTGGEVCNDGDDDDFDRYVDCADPDCAGAAPCEATEATCGDGFDNDGDGAPDCADRDCDGRDGCEHGAEARCDDAFDNDADERADCADVDCWADAACLAPCDEVARPIACGDLVTQVEAGRQSFAAHACAPGDWRVPELVYGFAPTTAGTAHVGLSTLVPGVSVILYIGTCGDALACAEHAASPTVDFGEPLSFAFDAGQSYTIVVDAGPFEGVVAPRVVLDRLRLRCE